ncbi:MAG: hypothetical protein V1930_04535 [Pseudomonadota bacterium]
MSPVKGVWYIMTDHGPVECILWICPTMAPSIQLPTLIGVKGSLKRRRIGDWLVEQGIVPYDQMNALFSQITKPLQAQESEIENLKIAKMINSLSLKRP